MNDFKGSLEISVLYKINLFNLLRRANGVKSLILMQLEMSNSSRFLELQQMDLKQSSFKNSQAPSLNNERFI